MSNASNAATYRSSSARFSSFIGSGRSSVVSREPIVARARCSALLTDATDVSSSSAVSAADHARTSRRISTARWRGGR
ncbi:MAG: hypothetical protein J0J00_12510, partial [Microbacterium sp.]|nr:hypothetical protein [Microbacterium sp.]